MKKLSVSSTTLECSEQIMKELAAAQLQTLECVNWAEYPYKPEVKFAMVHNATHLYIYFKVEEKHLLAQYLDNNDPVYEDSCVEFFCQTQGDKYYYNFETNCIGTMLAAKRLSKTESTYLSDEDMARIIRIASLPQELIDKTEDVQPWELMIGIPFEVIGHESAPKSLRANIYKCGDKTSEAHFVSWSPIMVETPNFHLPEFFGELELE